MSAVKPAAQLQEHNQNFWQLACIQSAAQGLPVIMVGGQIAKDHGAGVALTSVWIGNLILWMIGLAVISMTARYRKNAIENVEGYLGRIGAIFASLILMIAFVDWYVLQINSATDVAAVLFEDKKGWQNNLGIRVGAAFGFLTALLSIGGITLIRKICVLAFPFLVFFIIFAVLLTRELVSFEGTFGLSFSGVIAVFSVTLPGIINLPTFFRHSRTKADSFFALTLMTIFVAVFQSFSILSRVSDPVEIFVNANFLFLILTIVFVTLSYICINLVNIYFASAGWELIIPHVWSAKEYAIVGLLGTAAYTFLQISAPMIFLENMANNFIASLGIVLLMTFLVRIVVKHRPRNFEKIVSSVCWIIGCMTALVAQMNTTWDSSRVLVVGMFASLVAFIAVIFIEETLWSAKKLFIKRK